MPKGQKHDEQDKSDAVSQFEGLGGTPEAAKETAADFGVSPKTVQKWAKSLNGRAKTSAIIKSVRAKIADAAKSKKAPKRRTSKRAVKAKKNNQRTIDVVLKLYFKERNAYIEHRNAANELKKELDSMWKELD